MPNDGGVDVITGACAPAPKKPKKETQKGSKKKAVKKGHSHLAGKGYEDCSSDRILHVPAGVCSWFMVTLRGRRVADRQRKKIAVELRKLILRRTKSLPVHMEE